MNSEIFSTQLRYSFGSGKTSILSIGSDKRSRRLSAFCSETGLIISHNNGSNRPSFLPAARLQPWALRHGYAVLNHVAAFLWDEADAEKQQQDFRRWSEAEPEGDTGDGSVNALTIRSDHSVGAGHPLQPHPSPLPACSRVQRQPIDPPRKHPIRAQTAAGCSALSAHPTTCYKTQISLQQHTASRCSVCALISQGLHMLALNGPTTSHQIMRWASRGNKAGYASHRVRLSAEARRV